MTAVAPPPKIDRLPTQPRSGDQLLTLPLAQLRESPWNPRKHFDPAKLEEMADSLKKGQLAPIIVRPWAVDRERWLTSGSATGITFEIGAGHRRFRSAPKAGLTSLLAIVRDLDDVAFLELLTIENKQREDVEPLDEAAGFRMLMEKAGYDVAKLANRIGLSREYVYGRLKLLNLIPELKKLLEEKVITAGHGVLLARLKPADQKRVMGDPKRTNRYDAESGGGLFQGEYADHDPDQPGLELEAPVKARSVRELATYINDHVRFKPEENDLPNLFPSAATALQEAETDDLDPVYITYDHQLKFDAKDHKVRTYGVSSWRRADGKQKSKTCAWSRIGIVAAGRDRGDAFRVCVNRDKCDVHFAAARKAAKRRAVGGAKTPAREREDRAYEAQVERQRAERARAEIERARWKRALPTLRERLAAAIKAAPTGGSSESARIVLHFCTPAWAGGAVKLATKLLPAGRTGDDVVRRAALAVVLHNLNEYRAQHTADVFKRFGLDAQKIVDQVVPKPKAEKPAAKPPAKKKGGRK